MALLTKIEAAIALGISTELLEWFVSNCPKRGESRKLSTIAVGKETLFDETEVDSFRAYLRAPWPKPKKGTRPHVPDSIREDVRRESHLGCAICGHMDNGEVAHIDAVAATLNNSPDNLILLCPNHHTKYDYGFRPASNVTNEEVRAAKLCKRRSRARIMAVEADVTRCLLSVMELLRQLEGKLRQSDPGSILTQIYLTEAKSLLQSTSRMSSTIARGSGSGSADAELRTFLTRQAPTIGKLSATDLSNAKESTVRSTMSRVVGVARDVLDALDEVDCPHCGGSGMRGLAGDYCKFCRGSQVVSSRRATTYDPASIDEVECPHCSGRGQTGLAGDLCSFCHGSQTVTHARAEAYDLAELDEVECPHCSGRGQTGLAGDLCRLCRGAQIVTQKKAQQYTDEKGRRG